jgi:hypothetical protein
MLVAAAIERANCRRVISILVVFAAVLIACVMSRATFEGGEPVHLPDSSSYQRRLSRLKMQT